MATYKKRGQKKSLATIPVEKIESESTTAEVFETLDNTASKTEQLVSKYQNFILIAIVLVAISVLSYLGYKTYIYEPKKLEAVGELSQAQYYFELALNSQDSDSLYLRALNGGEGKFGFLDIIENYEGTPAGMLANYSAGMSYLNLKDYVNAIDYLDKFKSDDVLLFGREDTGLPDSIIEKSDSLVSIFMPNLENNNIKKKGVRSLNLSVACGIAIYEAHKQINF